MTELLRLAPSTAVLITRDESGHTVAEEEVPTALIQRGDLLKARPQCFSDELGLCLDVEIISRKAQPIARMENCRRCRKLSDVRVELPRYCQAPGCLRMGRWLRAARTWMSPW